MGDTPKSIEPFKWQPGQSGNKAGKPVGAVSRKTILRQILDLEVDSDSAVIDKLRARFPELFTDKKQRYTLEFLITLRHVLRAITTEKPDRAIIDILDRVHGRPLQSFNLMSNADLEDDAATSDQIREQIADLQQRRRRFEDARNYVSDTEDEPGTPDTD